MTANFFTMGAAWSNGDWYIYINMAFSNGNLFVGNIGDNYSNIFDSVADFCAIGNNSWKNPFNINFGYYNLMR